MDSHDVAPRRFSLRRLPGLGLGVAVAVAVLAAGLYVAAAPQQWTAHSDLLVSPDPEQAAASTSAYYETLDTGSVTGTAAAIVENPALVRRAAEASGVDLDAVKVSVSVVPDTSLVRISTTAPQERAAVVLTDELARLAVPEVRALLPPYALSGLSPASDSVAPSGLSRGQVVGVAVLMALLAGAAAQQAVQQIGNARARRRYLRA